MVPACRQARSLALRGVLLSAAATAAAALGAATSAAPAGPPCAAPAAGRYVVMQQGSGAGQVPMARLLQETWRADGRVEGLLMERQGRRWREVPYSGQVGSGAHCRATIRRAPAGGAAQEMGGAQHAEVVLDGRGRPAYSLDLGLGSVTTGRWWLQAPQACRTDSLNGVVLSQQQGWSWRGNRWEPNAVVQREVWSAGRVRGVALSSYGGRQEVAGYTGSLSLGSDCLGRLTQTDEQGTSYDYAVAVLSDGSGYLYLQRDPDDLTIGWLERR
jgi:hypothetical protein